MTEAMPFLQKAILLSYESRPFGGGIFFLAAGSAVVKFPKHGLKKKKDIAIIH